MVVSQGSRKDPPAPHSADTRTGRGDSMNDRAPKAKPTAGLGPSECGPPAEGKILWIRDWLILFWLDWAYDLRRLSIPVTSTPSGFESDEDRVPILRPRPGLSGAGRRRGTRPGAEPEVRPSP